MLAQWMESFFGRLRFNQVTDLELAEELGVNPKYLSAVLNGHKTPRNAEEKLNAALDRIIERRNAAELSGEQPKDSTEKVR